MKSFLTLVICLLVSCTAFAAADGQAVKDGPSLFDRWSKKDALAIELYLDLDELEANRTTTNTLPARVLAHGTEHELSVSVRGRYRRRTCAMPPLKLQFAKAGLRAHGLNTHNDFKLVTHCSDDAAGREALIREQLAYELYNVINPTASFRTQLLEITYVNTADGSRTRSLGILIEDYDELQDRLGQESCKDCYGSTATQITNAEEVALFQYMIGNVDYCTRMSRNLKLLTNAAGTRTAVPYDFDFSGLVNANYASVSAVYGQRSVTDRVLLWNFEEACDLDAAAQHFLSREAELLETVTNHAQLSKRSKREIGKYLAGFFAELRAGEVGLSK